MKINAGNVIPELDKLIESRTDFKDDITRDWDYYSSFYRLTGQYSQTIVISSFEDNILEATYTIKHYQHVAVPQIKMRILIDLDAIQEHLEQNDEEVSLENVADGAFEEMHNVFYI